MGNTKRKNKNLVAVLVLVLLLAFLAAGGTIAWLTRTSSISNTFTIGTFTPPETDPLDPTQTITLEGNLYEPSWDASEEHRLVPSVSFAKDPYVGIGPGSEDAAVYIFVENSFSNKVYFTLNDGWLPVTGHVTTGSLSGTYTSGLFKYSAGLQAGDDTVWTSTPIFSSIDIADDATMDDFTVEAGHDLEIVVTSFLHQAKDSAGEDIAPATIEAAAIATFEN